MRKTEPGPLQEQHALNCFAFFIAPTLKTFFDSGVFNGSLGVKEGLGHLGSEAWLVLGQW